jgi:hypothetical protein
MSILAQQTDITLANNTNYYLDVTILAEQDEEFRMTAGSNNNVIPISNGKESVQGMFGAIVNGLMDVFTGSKLHEIRINLPARSSVPIHVRCTSSLSFNTSVVSQNTTDHISGDFDLGPEYHGNPIQIQWKGVLGYGYDKDGDVALGGKLPAMRDLAINTEFYDKNENKIAGPDVSPACCKIKFS